MGAAPLVSVVMPTFDRWPLVAEAVDSVLGQDLADLELVVVDDGSSDGTAEHLAGRDPRLRVLCQPNRGRSSARNAGIQAARGRWIAFLDSDDLWEPWHLAQAITAAGDSTTSALAAPITLFDPDSGSRRVPPAPRWLPDDLRAASLVGMAVTLPGLVVPRDALVAAGAFDEDLRGSEDWAMLVRLTRTAPIARLPRPSVLVRVHEGRSMADVDWDLEWRRRATELLLADESLRLDDRERRLLRGGTHRYAAARLYEIGRMSEARRELVALQREVGIATALRWAGRLAAQTGLGGRGSRLARRVADRRRTTTAAAASHGPVRVLYVVHKASHNRILNSLIDESRGRLDLTVAALVDEGSMKPDLDARAVPLIVLPPGRRQAIAHLRRELASGRHDLVQPNGYLAGIHVELARALMRPRPPSLLGRHHNLEHHLHHRRIHRVLDGWSARHATRVLAVSPAVKDTLTSLEGVSAESVIVVNNGSSWHRLDPDAARVTELRSRVAADVIAVAIGRIDPIKDYPTVLRAVAIARRSHPALVLAIAGTGDPAQERALDDLAAELGISDAVVRLGWVPDIGNLHAAADVFVQASLDESFGESVLEAMGAGVPIAVTTVGGVRDIVAGWYPTLSPGDPAALAAAIVDRLEDPDARQLAQDAAQDVRRRYSAALMTDCYVAACAATVKAGA